MDALTTAEHVLTKMMEAIAGDTAGPPGGGYEDEDEVRIMYYVLCMCIMYWIPGTGMSSLLLTTQPDLHLQMSSEGEGMSVATGEEAPNYNNNVRIKSRKLLREWETEDFDGMGGLGGGGGVGAEGESLDVSEEVLLKSAAGVGVGGDDIGIVPNRLTVKTLSSRRTNDEKRKEDMAIRRKKLMDRMLESKGNKGGGGEGGDARIGLTAQYKAQKAAGDRLVNADTGCITRWKCAYYSVYVFSLPCHC